MNKIYLIDGMSLIFRAYHALSNTALRNSEGLSTSAIFGLTNIITSLLEREKPNYFAMVYDRSEPTFRHIQYPPYKQNREEFPEDLSIQLPYIKELIRLLSIPQFEMAGYEADDIIGSIAKQFSNQETLVYCVTSDKDYYQLVDENIKILKPGNRGEDFGRIDFLQVEEKFGVHPNQVIEVMALTGDSIDNIPGVKGVGEKTAIPLIQKYHTLENLYDNLDNIEKKSLVDKLLLNKEMAFISRDLVTIKTDIELNIELHNLKMNTPLYEELDQFFQKVGFNTLRMKWKEKALKHKFESSNQKSIVDNQEDISEVIEIKELINDNKKYTLLDTIEKVKNYLETIKETDILSFDLETDSLNRDICQIVGIALSNQEDQGCYIPVNSSFIRENYSEGLFSNEIKSDFVLLDFNKIKEFLKPILENPKIGKCGQNAKFDMYILKRFGINVQPLVFDTMIASYLIDPDEKHNLDSISRKYLNYSPIPITSLIGEKKSTQISMKEIDPIKIKDYACEDADVALKLTNELNRRLEKDGLINLAKNIEFPLITVLTQMESDGVSIDTKVLKEISKDVNQQISIISKEIYNESGVEFNIDSPKQLSEVLFEKMQIKPLKKNKTGFSTDIQVLTELAATYPFISKILEYRHLVKLRSTYIEALPKLINPTTNRIHTTYNQTIASTGRLSSTDPNLQNIPVRTDLGKEIRKAFVARDDNYVILSADYSQIELRIMAFMSKDKHLINSFKEGLDIHSSTGSVLYNIPLNEVNSDIRRIAKTVNFGIMYGLGSFGLSQRLSISRKEAKDIIDNYFAKYPGIKKYMERTIEFARNNGYVESMMKRRKYFPDINNKSATIRAATERAVINMPIQGTASDMIKIAMIKVSEELNEKRLSSKLIMQVHDELVLEVEKSELDLVKQIVVNNMTNSLQLGEVPVTVEYGIGNNWLEAH